MHITKNENQGFCSGHPISSTPHSAVDRNHIWHVHQKAYSLVYILTSSIPSEVPFLQNKNENQGFCSGHPISSTPQSAVDRNHIYAQVYKKAYRLVYILTSSMLK